MATKNPKGRAPKRAVVVTVEVPQGTKGRALLQRIANALLEVPTDIFEPGDAIVVSNEFEGGKPPRPRRKV